MHQEIGRIEQQSDDSDISDMVRIPGGTFRMGSDHHYPEEAPSHRVSIDGFWIDRTPVTNRQFKAFVKATGHKTFAEIVPDPKDYLLELDTDAKPFEGQGRILPGMSYPWQHVPCYGRSQSVQIYLPSRSAQVLAPV